MNTGDRVRNHFDVDARRFDAIYTSEKGLVTRVVDRLFRAVVVERFELTFARCGDVQGRTLLDVGCGSGRYPLRFATAGAARCIGIDFAPRMIDIASRYAREQGLSDRCEFICADFLQHPFSESFDIVTAMGFFDYIADPLTFLRKCRQVTRGRFFASFPVSREWRVPIRRLRFTLRRCPVYFYSEEQVRGLCLQSGFTDFDIRRLSRDYYVEARAEA